MVWKKHNSRDQLALIDVRPRVNDVPRVMRYHVRLRDYRAARFVYGVDTYVLHVTREGRGFRTWRIQLTDNRDVVIAQHTTAQNPKYRDVRVLLRKWLNATATTKEPEMPKKRVKDPQRVSVCTELALNGDRCRGWTERALTVEVTPETRVADLIQRAHDTVAARKTAGLKCVGVSIHTLPEN